MQFWITYRKDGKTFQRAEWYATDELAARIITRLAAGAAWFRVTTATGRVVIDG